jgi:citrate lyase subunit beta-like protein
VPSSSPKFLQKTHNLTADTVCYDLEDSVAPARKPEARDNVRRFLSEKRPPNITELCVRINDVSTGLALDDLTSVLKADNIDAIAVPKVGSASDMHFITDVIRHQLPDRHPSTPSASSNPVKIIALIETAESIMNLKEICQASPYISGLVFAAEDFARDLSITRTPSLTEFLYARSAIATAARAFNLPSTIDLVCTKFRGEEAMKTLEEECLQGKGLGFNGKQCIHPSQVETAQRVFAPGKEEVEYAVRLLIADEKATAAGRGAFTLEGKMIDAPVIGKARVTVNRAKLCGIDVAAVEEEWKDQEPE